MLRAEPTRINVPMKQNRCMIPPVSWNKSWSLDLSQWLNPNHSCGRHLERGFYDKSKVRLAIHIVNAFSTAQGKLEEAINDFYRPYMCKILLREIVIRVRKKEIGEWKNAVL
ncbi:hypothetical protein V9K15_002426 [Vibrio cholerae]|nr:hypothetical protein [Vibrio cholerae]ELI9714500.1 hypothetical protein [Vibrio cholerae]